MIVLGIQDPTDLRTMVIEVDGQVVKNFESIYLQVQKDGTSKLRIYIPQGPEGDRDAQVLQEAGLKVRRV